MTIAGSLSNRIFLATALMAILSIGLAIYIVNIAVTRQAEEELRRGLEDSATVVEQYRDLLFEQFAREASLLADLPKLKAAVGVDHPPTVRPIAEDYRRQIGADLFVVTNADGAVLAFDGDADVPVNRIPDMPTIRAAVSGRAMASFWPRTGGEVQVVSVPIWIDETLPELLGTLTVGFSLDERLADRFKELTASDIAFFVGDTMQVTTLAPERATALASSAPPRSGMVVRLDGEDFVTVTRRLAMDGEWSPSGEADLSTPVAVILRSRTQELEFLRSLQTALAGTGLLAVFVAVALSYGVARTVTRPVGEIIATMRATSDTGDLTKKIVLAEHGPWVDEDTQQLGRTFNAMTDSIARFQREATQREQLSALGRLSTVIAHEIRNPLMIIKTAVRTFRRDDGLPESVRTAAADIDEEVARLNRIVGEVLDFARPIRFDLAPVDLDALCADSVAAVTADAADIAIRFQPDATTDTLMMVTDAERLRLALVNILLNAQQAVLARIRSDDATPTASPDITLLTRHLPDSQIAIVVRDRGIGIAPSDLGAIFEPYFTTKRTGSGLGLAIAKNIVTGLGGTIVATRHEETGTEMRIEIPSGGPADAAVRT
jgi:signal transduction histidine kinase